MQFEITDQAAIDFSRGFYAALAEGRGIDDAVKSGRISILGASGSTMEWITPVIYLRGDQSQIFDVRKREGLSGAPLTSEEESRLARGSDTEEPHDTARSSTTGQTEEAPHGFPSAVREAKTWRARVSHQVVSTSRNKITIELQLTVKHLILITGGWGFERLECDDKLVIKKLMPLGGERQIAIDDAGTPRVCVMTLINDWDMNRGYEVGKMTVDGHDVPIELVADDATAPASGADQ